MAKLLLIVLVILQYFLRFSDSYLGELTHGFLTACLVALSTWGWGRFWKNKDHLERWIAGQFFLIILGFILGLSRLYHPTILMAFVYGGLFLTLVNENYPSWRLPKNIKTRAIAILSIFVSIPVLWLALKPNFGVDQLYYHLPSQRYYLDAGMFTFINSVPFALHSGAMEIIYAYAYPLCPTLLHWHACTQFLHLIFGLGTCTVFVFRITSLLASKDLAWVAVLAFSAMGFEKAFAVSSKNDFMLCAQVLAAVYFGLEHRFRYFGMALILAANTKYFGLVTSGILTLIFFWSIVKNLSKRHLFRWFFWVSLLSSLLYIRNFTLSGNPIYPLFSKFFSSPYWTELMNETMHINANQGGEELTIRHLRNFAKMISFDWLAILAPLALLVGNKRKSFSIVIFILIFMVCWRFIAGGWFETQNRYIYFILGLLACLGASALQIFPKPIQLILGVSLALLGSRIDVRYREMEPFPKEKSFVAFARNHHAEFLVQEELRRLYGKDSKALSLYRPERLYAPGEIYTPPELPFLVDLYCNNPGWNRADVYIQLRQIKIQAIYWSTDDEKRLTEQYPCLLAKNIRQENLHKIGTFGTNELYEIIH